MISDTIDSHAEKLHELSEDIWNHPELGYEETRAHDTLTKFLEQHGFQVSLHGFIILGIMGGSRGGSDTPEISKVVFFV